MTKVVVARKVADVRARVERVRELLPADVETFLAERTRSEALILNLYLALQGASDLASHVVADRGYGVPADARGAFDLLERHSLLPRELTHQLSAAIGLRNRIAHEYGVLDLHKVYAAAGEDLVDLETFVGIVAREYDL